MISTRGIVFRTLRYKESSLIIDVFTESHGLLSCIINGVFKKGDQRLASVLGTGNIIQMVIYYSEHKTLHRIKEAQFAYVYRNLHQNLHKSALSLLMLEISRKSIREHMVNRDLYSFLQRCLILLDNQEPVDKDFHLKFMLKLAGYLGFQPGGRWSEHENAFDLLNGCFVAHDLRDHHHSDPESSKLISQLMTGWDDEGQVMKFQCSPAQRRHLLDLLTRYYAIHIENFGTLQSPAVYRSMFLQ
jgi:DNA repair protein RecO (recombination protein O)